MTESLEDREAPEAPEVAETPEAEPAAVPPADSVAEPAAVPSAKKPVRRGRIAAVAGAAVLLAGVIGGVGYTVVTVQGADRDAGAPVWHLPKTKAGKAKPASPSGLAGTLVPYGSGGWTRGPDLTQFGSDAHLSGAEATALRKESLRDLPRSQRKRMEKLIDEEHIKGMAMRSYLFDNTHVSGYTGQQSSTVSIVLAQLEDRADVRDASTFQNGFLDALGVFRKGPDIKGYKNAKCFLPPKDGDEKLDAMFCSAYQGNVLVTVSAAGPKPMQTRGIAKLLEEQLNRIKEPGKAV